MAAYVLFDNLEVRDPEKLSHYKSHAAPVVARYHGRYRVLGGSPTILEGNWAPAYAVMLEFPNAELARRWYHSEEYKALKQLRLEAVRSSAVLLDGLPESGDGAAA